MSILALRLFDVQDEIAQAITERLKVTLSGGVKRSTENPGAYELYLKGRHYWHQRTPATVHLAIQCFEDATKLDPRYALAYAALADCYAILRAYGWMSADDARPPARAAVKQAMTVTSSLWEVNFSYGFFGSEQEFVRSGILRGFLDFLKNDVFGVRDGHTLRFQQ